MPHPSRLPARFSLGPSVPIAAAVGAVAFAYTWRRRARFMRALKMLAIGAPVTTVALDVGYDNVSAFIELFRKTFGATPARHVSKL